MQVGVGVGVPAVGVAVAVAATVGVGVGVRVAVGVAVGVDVTVGVGVGVPHGSGTTLISTVLVSAEPLNPATTTRRFPIAVPSVDECGTFVFGPVLQALVAIS